MKSVKPSFSIRNILFQFVSKIEKKPSTIKKLKVFMSFLPVFHRDYMSVLYTPKYKSVTVLSLYHKR